MILVPPALFFPPKRREPEPSKVADGSSTVGASYAQSRMRERRMARYAEVQKTKQSDA